MPTERSSVPRIVRHETLGIEVVEPATHPISAVDVVDVIHQAQNVRYLVWRDHVLDINGIQDTHVVPQVIRKPHQVYWHHHEIDRAIVIRNQVSAQPLQ